MASKRISTQTLLLEGWHGIYTGGKQFWAHPQLCTRMVTFNTAAKVQRIYDKAKELQGEQTNG